VPPSAWVAVLWAGIIGTAGAHSSIAWAISRCSAVLPATYSTMQPVVTGVLAAVVLGQVRLSVRIFRGLTCGSRRALSIIEEWACPGAEARGRLQVLKPRDCVAMVIIMCGLLIVVVDRYRRERQRLADAATRGEYAAVSSKEGDAVDGDVELALAGGSATAAGAVARGPARRSIEIPVVAIDGHVPLDAGMLVATALPSGGMITSTRVDADRSWRIGTVADDAMRPLRPERELIPVSAVAS